MNPVGQKFHELTEAFELLKDATKRQALDVAIRATSARKERYASHDSKRKALIDELEENERHFKRQRSEKAQTQRAEASELERIKAQNQKLREGRQPFSKSEPTNNEVPELGMFPQYPTCD